MEFHEHKGFGLLLIPRPRFSAEAFGVGGLGLWVWCLEGRGLGVALLHWVSGSNVSSIAGVSTDSQDGDEPKI